MGVIREVGDSSILIDFFAWIDQRETGFGSARSQAIRDVKDALEAEGFSLPEPIYRVKMDGAIPTKPVASAKVLPAPAKPQGENLQTGADVTITEKVAQERQTPDGQTDLLDDSAPPE